MNKFFILSIFKINNIFSFLNLGRKLENHVKQQKNKIRTKSKPTTLFFMKILSTCKDVIQIKKKEISLHPVKLFFFFYCDKIREFVKLDEQS